ncbi:MAG: response regulator [Gammaproteobacteria bacterium]
MIKVLLVDDHELVRSGIQSLLNSSSNISVVGIAGTGEEAIEAVKTLKPDIVMMDVNMPGIGGMEACRRIIQHNPAIKIIALSVYNDGPVPQQLMKLGAMGFICKSAPFKDMVDAIHQVMMGKRYICPEVASNLALAGYSGNDASPFEKLSQREMEVALLTLQGKSITEMADMLSVASKTINTYRYRVYEKLNVRNDVELTRLAVKYRFIEP